MKIIHCDRCHKPISDTLDARLIDQLQKDYPGKDICPDCDQLISLTGEVAKQAALSGKSPQQIAAEWLELYSE